MKNLGNLKPSAGSNVGPKRLGRGPGSGLGKTSGKGHKGQRARKGGGIPPGFEGGQMPLYRRLPKRGFFSLNRVQYSVVNVSDLAKFDSGATVNAEALVKAGVITNANHPVKLLGDGELSKSLTVVVAKASAKAKQLVEKAGGKVQES